jgi:hypothetical protein
MRLNTVMLGPYCRQKQTVQVQKSLVSLLVVLRNKAYCKQVNICPYLQYDIHFTLVRSSLDIRNVLFSQLSS